MKRFVMRDADARKWRRLIREARRTAADPYGNAGELIAAARTARRAVAPDTPTQLHVTSPLIRHAEAFGDLSTACRAAAAETMKGLADRLAVIVGEPRGGTPATPVEDDDDAEDRPQRRDIYG